MHNFPPRFRQLFVFGWGLIFLAAAIIQLGVYSIALWVHIRGVEKAHKVSRAIYYLVLGHLSNLIGTIDYLRNKRKPWKLTS